LGGWPLCDGAIFPQGEEQTIQVIHRITVIGALIASVGLVRIAWRQRSNSRAIRRVAIVLGHLLIAQILVGALIPWTRFVQSPRVLHIAFATAVWGCAVLLLALAARTKAVDQTAGAKQVDPNSPTHGGATFLTDLVTLTKPRVMILLLLTATGGMVLATRGMPPFGIAIAVLIGGALASGGAGAINHGIEGGIDRAMVRTRERPVASGRISPQFAVGFGIALNAASFVLLSTVANVLAASLAIGGSLFYVFVYTMWLKRTTVQNIVIGGAAGAVPPLVGWAAITGGLDLPAFYLFGIVFFWTPPHFWALSLLIQDDYARADVPMLPVVKGETATHWSIFLYVVLVDVLTVMFFLSTQSLGYLYLGAVLALGGLFGFYAWRLLIEKHRAATLRLYKYSILYLALVFLVVMVDGSI
jgi:protoheme IX farnesyltransferase